MLPHSPMRAVIVSPVRMLGEGLAECLNRRPEITVAAVVPDLSALRKTLFAVDAGIVLIDITQALDFEEVRAFAAERPNVTLVALGMEEQRRDVMRRGRGVLSGFAGRGATADELCDAIQNAAVSHLTKPAGTSPGLMRRFFAWKRHPLTQQKNGR